jgi:hypothetical protein
VVCGEDGDKSILNSFLYQGRMGRRSICVVLPLLTKRGLGEICGCANKKTAVPKTRDSLMQNNRSKTQNLVSRSSWTLLHGTFFSHSKKLFFLIL